MLRGLFPQERSYRIRSLKRCAAKPSFVTSVEQNGRKWLVFRGVIDVADLESSEYCGSMWRKRQDYELEFPSLFGSKSAVVPEKKLLRHSDEHQYLNFCNGRSPRLLPSYVSSLKGDTRDPAVENQAKRKSPGQIKRDRDRQQLKRQAKRAAKKTSETLVYEGRLAGEDIKESSKEVLVERQEEENPSHGGQCQARIAELSDEISVPNVVSMPPKLDYKDEYHLRILSMFSQLHPYTIPGLVKTISESGSAARPMVGKTIPSGWQSQLEPYVLGAVYAFSPRLRPSGLGSAPLIEGTGLVVDRIKGYGLIMKHARDYVPLVGYCALFDGAVSWPSELNYEKP